MSQAAPDSAEMLATFDRIAEGYDGSPLRFFAFAADRAIALLKPRPGQKLLDVAAGTGAVALAAAQAVAPHGRVIASDLSEGMLARLQFKAAKFGLGNVDIHTMDATALDFRRDYFDHTVCGFGVFFLADMEHAVREWARVTKPGGTILFTAFDEAAFNPMLAMLRESLARRGVTLPAQDDGSFQRLGKVERCQALLASAGLEAIEVSTHQVGYHLKDPPEWWHIAMNAALRAFIDRLSLPEREALQGEHLQDVTRLMTSKGLWLNLPVHFARGRVPA